MIGQASLSVGVIGIVRGIIRICEDT
jgi:hypothetical protein